MDVVGAIAAWVGASLVVVADGRRGMALGVALAAGGLAVTVIPSAGLAAAAVIAVGGGAAAARRLTVGPGSWQIMPAGSTPRLVLCVGAGLLALWIALAVTGGPDAALRFAVMAAAGLAAARVLATDDPFVQLTSVSLLALAAGAAAGIAGGQPGIWPYVVAAVVAAGSSWLRVSVPRAA